MNKNEKRPATLAVSLAALICLFLFVGLGVSVFNNIDLSLLLFLSWLVAGMFAIFLGYTFSDVEEAAYDMAKNCIGPAAIIFDFKITRTEAG